MLCISQTCKMAELKSSWNVSILQVFKRLFKDYFHRRCVFFSYGLCLRKQQRLERGKEGGVTASRAYQRSRGCGGVVGEPIRGVRSLRPDIRPASLSHRTGEADPEE